MRRCKQNGFEGLELPVAKGRVVQTPASNFFCQFLCMWDCRRQKPLPTIGCNDFWYLWEVCIETETKIAPNSHRAYNEGWNNAACPPVALRLRLLNATSSERDLISNRKAHRNPENLTQKSNAVIRICVIETYDDRYVKINLIKNW